MKQSKIPYKKIALALSLCALILWGVLGTGASLAWFVDSTPELNNIFHVADFDLEVSHRLTDGTWEKVDSTTEIFDESALYEPGYVQVVYLKVENLGDIEFDFYTAVNVNGRTEATNVYGDEFYLQEYLCFGMTVTDSEEEMKKSIPDRAAAIALANSPLHDYHESQIARVAPGGEKYIALVVRMPENVDNAANYRGTAPTVELGITVKADQVQK